MTEEKSPKYMYPIPLEDLDAAQVCVLELGAVADLLNPETDLHAVNRENMGVLIHGMFKRLSRALGMDDQPEPEC